MPWHDENEECGGPFAGRPHYHSYPPSPSPGRFTPQTPPPRNSLSSRAEYERKPPHKPVAVWVMVSLLLLCIALVAMMDGYYVQAIAPLGFGLLCVLIGFDNWRERY